MKMFKCDICGSKCTESGLHEIIEDLKTDTIEHGCRMCIEEINEINHKIKEILIESQYSWMKKIIIKLRNKKHNESLS